jgi:hypothetical protein
MIHVIQCVDGAEYALADAEFDKKLELWIGEVVGKGVRIGINYKLVRIVFFFDSQEARSEFTRTGKITPLSRSGLLS